MKARQVCEVLEIKIHTLYNWCSQRDCPRTLLRPKKLGRFDYNPEEIRAWMNDNIKEKDRRIKPTERGREILEDYLDRNLQTVITEVTGSRSDYIETLLRGRDPQILKAFQMKADRLNEEKHTYWKWFICKIALKY